jgi:endo-alpha-1,4-polygalactosaminidase (GH114 family)
VVARDDERRGQGRARDLVGRGRLAARVACVLFVVFATSNWVDRAAAGPQSGRLSGVKSWGYQLQNIEEPGVVEALAASPYDLLVVEPTRSIQGSEDFDAAGMVERLHAATCGWEAGAA